MEYLRRNICDATMKIKESEDNNKGLKKNIDAESSREALLNNDMQKCIYRELDFYPQTTGVIFEKIIAQGLQMTVSEVMNAW